MMHGPTNIRLQYISFVYCTAAYGSRSPTTISIWSQK